MILRLTIAGITLAILADASTAQPCIAGQLQLQHDSLVRDPTNVTSQVAVIAGICVGDRAGAVFDLRGVPGPLQVMRGGILFAGPPGSVPGTGRLEVYDGVTFDATGRAILGPLLHRDASPQTWTPNTLTMIDTSALNLVLSSGILVVGFTIDSNPNEVFPGLGCVLGYTASFASDANVPAGSPCSTRAGTNLIYDPGNGGWWDVTRFQIGGRNWCGPAFNGQWVIRACVKLPTGTYAGTGEDLLLESGAGPDPLTAMIEKSAMSGEPVNFRLSSPNATFSQAAGLLLIDGFATGGPPLNPIGLGIHLSPNLIALGPLSLTGSGATQSFNIPASSWGASLLFQGGAISNAAQNGLFALSDAHLFLLY